MTELDDRRVSELRGLTGRELGSVVESMLQTMTDAVEQVGAGLAAERLDIATRAAHRCRNDALLVGATQLLRAMTELEAAARAGRLAAAREAHERVLEAWPNTREELERLAHPGPDP